MQHVREMDMQCEVPRWHQLKQLLVNLDASQFKQEMAAVKDAVLLDVRTEKEAEEFQLNGSITLDYLADDFIDKLEALDKESTYFVYCRTGRRSVRTCIMMRNSGIKNIFHLDGGVEAWKRAFVDLDN